MIKNKITKIALALSGLLFSGIGAAAQNAGEVISLKFPETAGELAINNTTVYKPALKSQYRDLYAKMNAGLAEIDKFEHGGAEAEVLEVFDIKTLKDMQKAGTLTDLKSSLLSEKHKIANLMREEKYGADSADCMRMISMFQEYAKQQNYADAYTSWTVLFKEYPKSSQNIYSNGVSIVKFKMSKAADRKEQELWIDTLMMVYDQRIKYFAATSKNYGEAYLLGRKGVDLLKYRKNPIEEPYNILSKAVDLGGKSTELAVIQTAMQATVGMFDSEKIDASVVVDRYLQLNDILDAQKTDYSKIVANPANEKAGKDAESKLATVNQVQGAIDQMFSNSKAAECGALNKAFEPRFDANPNDVEMAEKIVRIFDQKGCSDLALYEKATAKLIESKPSELACFNFAKMLLKKGKDDEAMKYFEQAVNYSAVDTMKAIYKYNIARIYQTKGQYSTARTYAEEAIKLKSNYGLPYIVIATMFAASPVGEDAFEKSKTYWVVIDMLERAKAVDPTIASDAQKLIGQYKGHCPKKEESFMHSITPGTSVTVGGWIGKTTTARFY
jgi:tetratricopeptide (TPR) repeat protein